MGRRVIVDPEAERADQFRRRAIELAMQAKKEDDFGLRRHLLDQARALVNVADEISPLTNKDSLAMTKLGERQTVVHRIPRRPASLSPDDIKAKLLARDQLAAADTRDAAARWLGDPPLGRSALAQRDRR